MKSLRVNYDGSAEGKRRMNIKKVDLKELYFKCQDFSPF